MQLRVIEQKVPGALVLESVHHDPERFFSFDVLCGFMWLGADRLRRRQHVWTPRHMLVVRRNHTVSIQWPRWIGTGMAAELIDPRASNPNSSVTQPCRAENDATTYSAGFRLETDWIVNEHRLSGGTGLFPTTGYLEMVRAAVADLAGTSNVVHSDYFLHQPLKVEPIKTARSFRCAKRAKPTASPHAQSSTVRRNGSNARAEQCYREAASVSRCDIEGLRRRCNSDNLGGEGSARNGAQERHIEFGPRWRNLERIWLGRNEALSLLQLPPDYRAEVGTYRLHPALLDMATGSAMFLIKGSDTAGYLYVPISYGRVSVSGQLPPTCYAYVRSKAGASIENPVAAFDVAILDREGNAIVR